MSSWSDRAQVEPIAALAAVFAVGVGLALYAGALDATMPRLTDDREMATTAADRLTAETSTFGAVEPPLSEAVDASRPTGYELNATLRTSTATWSSGPSTGQAGSCERRDVVVRVEPGRVRPGTLEVCAWRAG